MAKYSIYRLVRAIRSSCASIVSVVGFSCLLTWILILYQPTPGPGIKQRLGWQSWSVVSMYDEIPTQAGSSTSGSPGKPQTGLASGTDWWNVTAPAATVDSASLPLDQWGPLLPHDTGLSEISLTLCRIDPFWVGDRCNPETTNEKDSVKGNWVRIPRNLNLEGGYLGGYLNLYYRRTRRQDVPLITDLKLLPKDEQPTPSDGWAKVSMSLRLGIIGIPPLFLWYRLGKTSAQMNREERANLVTEIDLLYGDDDPWYGFERLQPATIMKKPNTHVEDTWITYRRGVKVPPKAPPLHFSRTGKFKILQVADLHYSVSSGVCKDTSNPCDKSDNLTSTLLGRVIEAEAPDLVVFTGDQLDGRMTSWDPKSVLAKFAKAVTQKGIPWAAVFGNHDSEIGASREEQIQYLQALPYSLVQRGPKDIHGVGNYVLKVKSADASMTQLLTLYFLDSGDYSGGQGFWDFIRPTSLDWIRQNQIDWFLQESAEIKPIDRPFRPDTAKDLGKLWPRQQITPQMQKLAKPNALMFFHIPLPESYTPADKDARTGKSLDVGAHGEEAPGNSPKSDGFFEKAILKAPESDHINGSPLPEVKVIANGHCHVTDNCRRVKGTWLCFGGGGSFSGYGKVGFDRRFRIYDISDFGETIRTYKRTESDTVIDEMVLSGVGSAPM